MLKQFSFLTPLVLFLKGIHILTFFPQGICQSKISVDDDENANKDPVFDPEPVIAHCFKQFKQENFHLPQSRRWIIISSQKEDSLPVHPMPPPEAPPQPISSFKPLEAEDLREQPEDTKTWLSRRLKLRQDLESFGNTERCLQNKPSLTPSEAKVLQMIQKEHEAQSMAHVTTTKATKVSSPLCQMKMLSGLGACCHFCPLD